MPIAELNFLHPEERCAVVRPSTGGCDDASEVGQFESIAVQISDARGRNTSLDREGFGLRNHSTSIGDWWDDDAIAHTYEAELKSFLMAETGAVRVETFDHTRRASSAETRRVRRIREPSATVHNDYDAAAGLQRWLDFFPQESDVLSNHRLAVLNVWRSIAGTVEDFPIAFCDASSVETEDLVSVERVARDRTGSLQLLKHRDSQQWFYYPGLKANEVLLFKVYDSAQDGRCRFTPHTSFSEASSTQHERISIESRCFLLFDSNTNETQNFNSKGKL
ncbi:MAG: CmcJ/NvfI family oxidoreductase [Pseudomonadota bacterium]